ncbi:hypothetical protein CISG_04662 [Coccidioides immitis RMSCC 3703]|uniref:Eukaryotic membrane protein family-domain-containing protein n=1 Tax=Coccidioides immitis RMSCC 3703 TaxID=454286 RepID=A0A0J8QSS9_COCIT|nr:hypothetical protein CISG_04662 [Coccidioides immitis RMSCC 3703]
MALPSQNSSPVKLPETLNGVHAEQAILTPTHTDRCRRCRSVSDKHSTRRGNAASGISGADGLGRREDGASEIGLPAGQVVDGVVLRGNLAASTRQNSRNEDSDDSGGVSRGMKGDLHGLGAGRAADLNMKNDRGAGGTVEQQGRAWNRDPGRKLSSTVMDSDRGAERHINGLGIKAGGEDAKGVELGRADMQNAPVRGREEFPPLSDDKLQPLTRVGENASSDATPNLRGKSTESIAENTTSNGAASPPERPAVQIENSAAVGPEPPTTTTTTTASTKHPLRDSVGSPSSRPRSQTLKLSSEKIRELTSAPDSLCLRSVPADIDHRASRVTSVGERGPVQVPWAESEDGDRFNTDRDNTNMGLALNGKGATQNGSVRRESGSLRQRKPGTSKQRYAEQASDHSVQSSQEQHSFGRQRSQTARMASTPSASSRRLHSPFGVDRQSNNCMSKSRTDRRAPGRLNLEDPVRSGQSAAEPPSPVPAAIPLPPFSIPTYLQLELSSERPSPLYIHQSRTKDFPYESSRVKLERLQNFLLLPPSVEQVLLFGTLACLDSWLYSFTILPLRFCKSILILFQSWAVNVGLEAQYISSFIVQGLGRVWRRRKRSRSTDKRCKPGCDGCEESHGRYPTPHASSPQIEICSVRFAAAGKADILKGLLMILNCTILLYFDASRMYHWIRGQAAIKLYVIYNVLEVGDRLFSAIGQDVLECLFSREALERGRTAEFVEIKSTVFKKFEKENLFQLTCADVVERFQLWLMLIIIASRNFVETGAVTFGNALAPFSKPSPTPSTNSTPPASPPMSATSILPQSFTLFPSSIFLSLSSVNSFLPTIGHVLGPFLVVLGSEMLVDWLKHAYINKFNNIRPSIYGRFLDILTKDYYTNAFADQNLNRRLGLPIIPLSCLFFRVSIQTYQMFLTAWLPQSPSLTTQSNATSLSSIHSHYSSTSTANLPSSFPLPTSLSQIGTILETVMSHTMPSPATFIPVFTVILVLLLYVTLLLVKLILGMTLLSFSRARYKRMKLSEREMLHQQQKQTSSQGASILASQTQLLSPPPDSAPPSFSIYANSKPDPTGDTVEGSHRVGGWGAVEVGEGRRRWIYADDPEALRKLKEREERDANKAAKSVGGLHGIGNIRRYEMVAKRIW